MASIHPCQHAGRQRWRISWFDQQGQRKSKRFDTYSEALTHQEHIDERAPRPPGPQPHLISPTTVRQRICGSIQEAESGCWIWQPRSITKSGYAQFSRRIDGRQTSVLAHRASYEAFVGPIPDGLQIDHLCRNRSCVNPAHLEPVTSQVNNARRSAARIRAAVS